MAMFENLTFASWATAAICSPDCLACPRRPQGYCTLQMWRALSGPEGMQLFAAWICALVLESSPERRAFSRHGRQQYVGRDAVAALHAVSSSRVGVACLAGWLQEGVEACDGAALPAHCSAVLETPVVCFFCACLQLLRVQQTQSLDLQAFQDLLQVGGC